MRILTAAFEGFLLLTSGILQATSTPQIILKDLSEYGLRLFPAADSKFQEYLNAALKGKSDPRVEAGKRFSVLLENRSDVDLIAYSLRWIGTDSAGKTVPMGSWFIHLLNTDNQSLWIHAGEVAIVSPHFGVIGSEVTHQGGNSYPDPLDRMAQMATVEICLDAALFKDGRFVGPNETHAYERAISNIQSTKGMMEEILSRHANGQSDEALLAWLQGLARSEHLSGNRLDWYVQFDKQNAATRFLIQYQTKGSESAFAFASREAARPVLKITRVPYIPR